MTTEVKRKRNRQESDYPLTNFELHVATTQTTLLKSNQSLSASTIGVSVGEMKNELHKSLHIAKSATIPHLAFDHMHTDLHTSTKASTQSQVTPTIAIRKEEISTNQAKLVDEIPTHSKVKNKSIIYVSVTSNNNHLLPNPQSVQTIEALSNNTNTSTLPLITVTPVSITGNTTLSEILTPQFSMVLFDTTKNADIITTQLTKQYSNKIIENISSNKTSQAWKSSGPQIIQGYIKITTKRFNRTKGKVNEFKRGSKISKITQRRLERKIMIEACVIACLQRVYGQTLMGSKRFRFSIVDPLTRKTRTCSKLLRGKIVRI